MTRQISKNQCLNRIIMLKSKCFQNNRESNATKTDKTVSKILKIVSKALGQSSPSNHCSGEFLQVPRPDSPLMKRKSEGSSSEAESIFEILESLRRGYVMTKHSQNTDPHTKFVYVSEDHKSLCWKSLDKEDQKCIPLKSITSVLKEGAENYLKAKTVTDLTKCILVMSENRQLQLQASSEYQAEMFKEDLQRLLKYSKSMSLNYQYRC